MTETKDNALLVSASYDQTIRIWGISQGKMLATIQHNEGQVNALSLTSNGRDLALGAYQRIRIYDVLVSKDPKATIDLPRNVTVVGFEVAGKWMYTGGDDGVCRIWEMRNNQLVANRILSNQPAQVTSMVPNVNQTEVFVSTNMGQVLVWDIMNYLYQSLPMPNKMKLMECVQKLTIHPSGKKLIGMTNLGRLLCWDLMTRQLDVMPFDIYKNTNIAIEHETSTYGELRDDGKVYRLRRGYGLSCRYSPDGKYLVACGSDREVHVLNAESMCHTATLDAQCEWNWDAIFSDDGRHIFTGGGDNRVKIWDTTSGKRLAQWDGHTKPITAMCINAPAC